MLGKLDTPSIHISNHVPVACRHRSTYDHGEGSERHGNTDMRHYRILYPVLTKRHRTTTKGCQTSTWSPGANPSSYCDFVRTHGQNGNSGAVRTSITTGIRCACGTTHEAGPWYPGCPVYNASCSSSMITFSLSHNFPRPQLQPQIPQISPICRATRPNDQFILEY
jgi:hypothetical protein